MDKDIFDSIMRGANEAVDYMEGKRKGYRMTRVQVPEKIDVKALRARLRMTQKMFAETFGFSLDTIKHWESGRRTPESHARILLKVIEKNPAAVLDAAGH